MATYFADTAFWIALASRRDQYHARAATWHAELTRTRSRIVTTEAVLWEWLNAFADAATRALAAEAYRRVHADSRVEVIPFDPGWIAAAVDLHRARTDKDWSLTDCLSSVVMERRQLAGALTTDHHFEQAGHKAMLLALP